MKNKKGIYLGAYKANHEKYDISYQDINGKRDIPGDMMDINLVNYDYVIATPPCNYYSRANYRRETSEYSQKTKHLLPGIIDKLLILKKPFIVENVRNKKLFEKIGLLNKQCYIYFVGRHTYWTNVSLDLSNIIQIPKIDYKNGKKRYLSSQNLARKDRQGTLEVHEVIEVFLREVNNQENKNE